MASESMHGRGYVNEGDKIAANYIRTEFKKFGLKSFTKDYYQGFSFPVNTFPGEVSFSDGFTTESNILPDVGFLINADCPTVKGEYKVIKIDSFQLKDKNDLNKFISKKYKGAFILIDTIGIRSKEKKQLFETLIHSTPRGIRGFVIFKAVVKMSNQNQYYNPYGPWDVSQTVAKLPVIQILKWQGTNPDNCNIKKIKISVDSKFISNYPSQNVVSYIPGSEYPDSFIVFSAHYDHLGCLGTKPFYTYFPGANDNASGCAMLLNLAKYYSMPEHKPKCSIAFIAFGGEEVGLLGSKYYTEHPLFPLKNIKFLLNMDIMGTGEEGITVVNGTLFKPEFEKLKQINTENDFIKDVKIRGKAANSDHYFFSENGVRSFFIYTMGGIKAYHDIYDRAETLPLNEFEDLFKMIIKFSTYLQN